MTHEELQREYADDVERGVLPAPNEKYASKLVRDEDCPQHRDEHGYIKIDQTPAHIRCTVRYLTQTEALTVWVHFHYCDFSGHGNEMWSGNDSLQVSEFREKFPVKLSE